MENNLTLHPLNLIGGLICIGLSVLTFLGMLQQHIKFSSVINEIGFTLVMLIAGLMLSVCSISKSGK